GACRAAENREEAMTIELLEPQRDLDPTLLATGAAPIAEFSDPDADLDLPADELSPRCAKRRPADEDEDAGDEDEESEDEGGDEEEADDEEEEDEDADEDEEDEDDFDDDFDDEDED